jgi:signal transduction histidine kinase
MHLEIHEPTEGLPVLPAAVEVAAYRIAIEALTNISRHSHARQSAVSFNLISINGSETLLVEITDDGIGLPENPQLHLGMTTMRERAEEIGGRLQIESPPDGGTRVCAHLPLVE